MLTVTTLCFSSRFFLFLYIFSNSFHFSLRVVYLPQSFLRRVCYILHCKDLSCYECCSQVCDSLVNYFLTSTFTNLLFYYSFDYTWLDNNRKPVHLPAPQYIEYVLAWIENRLHDQNVFPTKAGLPFPSNFLVIVKAIYKQMFRIFAHMYYAHYAEILHLSLEAHWNSFFAHFIAFGKEFQLLDKRDTAPLKDLIVVLENQGNI